MKTFEFKINAGAGNEFTFYFDAQNLHTAEAIAKTRTKRGRKFEYVATHPVETLQQIQNEDHSAKIATQHNTFFFSCANDDCDHCWASDNVASIDFQECCPLCSRKRIEVSPVTYDHYVDWRENPTTSNVASA